MDSNKIEEVKGKGQGSSSAPPRRKRQEKQKSFWTSCDKCNTKYEYAMFYLNRNVWCQFCKERDFFRATEKPATDVNGLDSAIKSNSTTAPAAATVGPIALPGNLRRGLFMPAAAGESSGRFQSAARGKRKCAAGRMGLNVKSRTREVMKLESLSVLKDKAVDVITKKLQQLELKGKKRN